VTTPAQPPARPGKLHLIRHNAKALVRKPSGIRSLIACQHRYANGTSAWSVCKWRNGAWYTQCAICGLIARCT
jgi:hypothetical protein